MLNLTDITVRLGGRTIIDGATTRLPPRGRIGLIGRNGAGKTTLVRVITGVIDRTYAKYRGRAAQYVTLEAGHCAQNVLLAAVTLGLGAVPIGAFSDEAVRRRLGLTDELTPYYLIPVGTARAGTG